MAGSVFGILNLSPLSVCLSTLHWGECMLSLVNPMFSGTQDGVWKKEGAPNPNPPLHSAIPLLPCQGPSPSVPVAITVPAVGSQCNHLWSPLYRLAGPAPSTSLLTLPVPPSTSHLFLLPVLAV